MKLFLALLGAILFCSSGRCQRTAPRLSKDDGYEMLYDLAHDTFVLRRLGSFTGAPVPLGNLPYVCTVAAAHPVAIEFCPECTWIVDSSVRGNPVSKVSVSSGGFGISLKNVTSSSFWGVGDTVPRVLLLIFPLEESHDRCVLVPAVSNAFGQRRSKR